MDFMFGNFGLPLATLLIVLTVGWKVGPERIRVLALNRNSDVHIGRWWNPVIKYAIPAIMSFIIVYYVITNVASSFARTAGGLALMAGLLIVAVIAMETLRGGGEPTETDTIAGDD